MVADASGTPLYIGSSEGRDGLDGRYRGGTASTVDAALDGSGNQIFVAGGPRGRCEEIEKALIYAEQPRYNRQGRTVSLSSLSPASLTHSGDAPRFASERRVTDTA